MILRFGTILLLCAAAVGQNVVHYTTTNANVKYLFATAEPVHWIHRDYGLPEMDAYELLSKVARIHLNEMVDPNYVVVASIDKKYLPKRK